jgi:ZIP family zinc transporter
MLELLKDMHPVAQAFIATCFTWLMTALGAGVVFFAKNVNRKFLDGMLGFAAGAMIFVAVEALIPESQRAGNTDIATMGAIAGFVVMMVLAVGLG